ncbi:MAG TPA: hypothetical protein VGV36_07775, partial [Solirubrobacteraceae bacterium]|nr:hypothetical protein [Solirubrobacteraceae bacterium]
DQAAEMRVVSAWLAAHPVEELALETVAGEDEAREFAARVLRARYSSKVVQAPDSGAAIRG